MISRRREGMSKTVQPVEKDKKTSSIAPTAIIWTFMMSLLQNNPIHSSVFPPVGPLLRQTYGTMLSWKTKMSPHRLFMLLCTRASHWWLQEESKEDSDEPAPCSNPCPLEPATVSRS
jgi:hypothetical protein